MPTSTSTDNLRAASMAMARAHRAAAAILRAQGLMTPELEEEIRQVEAEEWEVLGILPSDVGGGHGPNYPEEV